ncbi:uncharacterized protein [Apostichopus japonicus]|uniref:uncharacterized protein n=1 Tax=Stichopus japonicus TaxID=307972 RepID=UPI003AB64124
MAKLISDDEKLIETVRLFPNLYNTSLREYRDTERAVNSWKEIGKICSKDWKECKDKWRKLRDAFVKVKKSMKTKRGDGAKRQTKWPYYEVMSFLGDHVKHRKTETNMGVRSEMLEYKDRSYDTLGSEEDLESTILNHLTPTKEPSSSLSSSTSSSPPNEGQKRKSCSPDESIKAKKAKRVDAVDMAILDRLAHIILRADEDEDSLFGRIIGATLKKFSPREKALCKLKIQEVLFQQEDLIFTATVS